MVSSQLAAHKQTLFVHVRQRIDDHFDHTPKTNDRHVVDDGESFNTLKIEIYTKSLSCVHEDHDMARCYC